MPKERTSTDGARSRWLDELTLLTQKQTTTRPNGFEYNGIILTS